MSEPSEPVDDLERRVARLEEIITRLDPTGGSTSTSTPAESLDARTDETPLAGPESGTVSYGGTVDLNGRVSWNISYSAASVLDLPTDNIVEALAALGHPARISIVRTLLRGNASVASLQDAGDFGTTGQLYHHLRILTSATVVTKVGRNEYGIAPTHIVPILVAVLAAGDIAGAL